MPMLLYLAFGSWKAFLLERIAELRIETNVCSSVLLCAVVVKKLTYRDSAQFHTKT